MEGGEKTSFTNCSQLCLSSSHFSCQELQARALPSRLWSNRNPSQGEGLSIHPQALHRDFNNYTYTLPLSARAAIMFFITAAAASTQGQWIGDEIFAAMAEYKASPSAVRIIIELSK